MRRSTKDPDKGRHWRVYLNNHHVRHAVAADDKEGWVDVVLFEQRDGPRAFVYGEDGMPATIRLYGEARFEFTGRKDK